MQSIMSARDVNHTYAGTWLRVRWDGSDEHRPVFVREAYRESDSLVVQVQDVWEGFNEEIALYDEGTDVIWEHPRMGFVNVDSYAVHHNRVAARQWKRGLRESQIRSRHIGIEMMHECNRNINSSFGRRENITEIFNPTFMAFEEAVYSIYSQSRFGTAFSPEFAVGVHPHYTRALLYYKGNQVGTVTDGCIPELSHSNSHLEPRLNKARGV